MYCNYIENHDLLLKEGILCTSYMIIIYVSEAMDRHATPIFDLMQFFVTNQLKQNMTPFTQKGNIIQCTGS